MADINLIRAHNLGLKAARTAADKMMTKLSEQFGMSGKWSGDTLVFERSGVSGTLAVTDKEMVLAVTLGFLLKAMRGGIERSVNEQLDKVLAEGAKTEGTDAGVTEVGKGASRASKPPKAAPSKAIEAVAKKPAAKKK